MYTFSPCSNVCLNHLFFQDSAIVSWQRMTHPQSKDSTTLPWQWPECKTLWSRKLSYCTLHALQYCSHCMLAWYIHRHYCCAFVNIERNQYMLQYPCIHWLHHQNLFHGFNCRIILLSSDRRVIRLQNSLHGPLYDTLSIETGIDLRRHLSFTQQALPFTARHVCWCVDS